MSVAEGSFETAARRADFDERLRAIWRMDSDDSLWSDPEIADGPVDPGIRPREAVPQSFR